MIIRESTEGCSGGDVREDIVYENLKSIIPLIIIKNKGRVKDN